MIDTIGFNSWLPDDYSITALQEFSHTMLRMAKNLNASQYQYKQRQTKYTFFYFSNEANNKNNPRCLRIRGHQILEFL